MVGHVTLLAARLNVIDIVALNRIIRIVALLINLSALQTRYTKASAHIVKVREAAEVLGRYAW